MAILTTVIGLPFWVGGALGPDQPLADHRLGHPLARCSACYLVYQIGFVDGLFTGDFNWEPA